MNFRIRCAVDLLNRKDNHPSLKVAIRPQYILRQQSIPQLLHRQIQNSRVIELHQHPIQPDRISTRQPLQVRQRIPGKLLLKLVKARNQLRIKNQTHTSVFFIVVSDGKPRQLQLAAQTFGALSRFRLNVQQRKIRLIHIFQKNGTGHQLFGCLSKLGIGTLHITAETG